MEFPLLLQLEHSHGGTLLVERTDVKHGCWCYARIFRIVGQTVSLPQDNGAMLGNALKVGIQVGCERLFRSLC